MHALIAAEFRRHLSGRCTGRSVLEIGATPTADTLLHLDVFADCAERIGINLDGGESYGRDAIPEDRAFPIVRGNSNDMSMFPDDRFDIVVSNSVMEHDRFFWKTLAEVRRVTRPGGTVAIACPGYDELKNVRMDSGRTKLRRWLTDKAYPLTRGTTTLFIHAWPGDYYRFSPQAFREVVFEGFEDVEVYSVMLPPRIFGIGRKPAA